jgi:hypothetical protein
VSKNEADPMYALVKGGDNYADIVVSRWSVKTVADVNNIATKSINYEKTPDASGDWYSKGAGVASNQSDGSGPDHPLDKERAELLRGMMMKWHYKAVDQIYDPSASKAALAKALNEGRGFINYIGHGSETLWGTTGFSNSDINALTNKNMLPFIVSVACVNGHFAYTGGDSFAEVWLKTGSDTNPRGAIGIFASSTNQSWVEPTVGQKSVTELLVGEKLNTMGALFFQGAVAVLESGMSAALQTVQSWHTFGDGTLQVRTTKPAAIKMRMPTVLNAKDTTLALNVGEKNLVASVVQEDELIGTAVSAADGSLTITYEKSLTSGKNATITVTGFNKVPQIADIPVGAKKKKKTMFENILDRLL